MDEDGGGDKCPNSERHNSSEIDGRTDKWIECLHEDDEGELTKRGDRGGEDE